MPPALTPADALPLAEALTASDLLIGAPDREPDQEAAESRLLPMYAALAPANGPAGTASVLFLYRTCREFVAHAVTMGVPPDLAVAAWQAEAVALIAAFRPRRRWAVLVAVFDAGPDTDALGAALQGRGLALPAPAQIAAALTALLPPPDPDGAPGPVGPAQTLDLLIAAEVLRHTPQARKLEGELEASAVPLGDPAGQDVSMASAAFADRQAAVWATAALEAQNAARIADLTEARDQAQEQSVAQAQEGAQALDRALAQAAQAADARLAEHLVEHQEAQAKAAEVQSALTAEVTRLTAVNGAAQTEIAALRQALADLQARLTALLARHEAQTAEHSAEHSRLGADLADRDQRLVRSEADHAALHQDVVALRATLDQARAALRTGKLHQTDSAQALADQDHAAREAAVILTRHQTAAAAAGQQQNRLQTALTKAEAQADRLRADLQAEQERAQALEQDLREVHTSTSWRVTGPMRGTRRLLDPKARNHGA